MRYSILPFALLAQSAFAGGADPGMLARLQELYPKTQFSRVSVTEVPGVFEVVMGKNVAYVDNTGRYFIFGRFYDMQTQKDLTPGTPGKAASAPEKVDVKVLPKEIAMKTVKGNGERVLYVFTDPDCPYCRKLEKSLTRVDNVTIYTYLMPLESLHPNARAKAEAIWCAKDREKAWNELMLMDREPAPVSQCNAPIDQVQELAASLGINGTPTLIASDGRKASGARDSATIDAWINTAPAKTAAVQPSEN